MTRIYVADAQLKERSALRLLLLDLNMEVVGEAADWLTTLANAPATRLDMLLIDWELLPVNLGQQSLLQLRALCPKAIVIVLIGRADARHQAALSVGADLFISKAEMPTRLAERLRLAAVDTPLPPSPK